MCGVYLFNGPNWQLGCVLCGTNIRIPRLSRRFRYGASTALDRCDSFDERPDLAGCLICIPSTVLQCEEWHVEEGDAVADELPHRRTDLAA
jgi:hypothetical protein